MPNFIFSPNSFYKIEMFNGIKKGLAYLVYYHFWLGISIVGLCYQSVNINAMLYQKNNLWAYYILLFSSVLFLYNLHWGWSNTLLQGQDKTVFCIRNKKYVRMFMVVFGLISIFIFVYYFISNVLVFLLPLVLSFLYVANKILGRKNKKRIFFPKTFLVSFVIAYLTTLLPVIIANSIYLLSPLDLVKNGFIFIYQMLFVYCITFFFDLRDQKMDFKNNIFQLEMFIPKKYLWLFYYIVVSLMIVVLACFHYFFSLHSIAYMYSLWLPIVLLLTLPFVYRHFNHDYWYYFFLDGIMMTGGIILLVYKLF